MTRNLLLYLFITLSLTFCKSSKNQSESDKRVIQAEWHNWTGGQPGVGGTVYEIILAPLTSDPEFTSLTVDSVDIPIDRVIKTDSTIVLVAIESKSVVRDVIGQENASLILRSTNPERASLTYTLNDVSERISITNFNQKITVKNP